MIALNERVTNVEKVRKVEKIGQATHRRADAFDNSLGQFDKRVVVIMRDMDSKFQHELEKIWNNETFDNSLGQLDKRVVVLMRDMDSKFQHELEKIRNNEIEFEQNMETKLEGLTVVFREHKVTNEYQIGEFTNRLDQPFTEEKERW